MVEKQNNTGPVRLGIIGSGLAVKWLHWPALQTLPGHFKIVAVCDIAAEARNEVSRMAVELNREQHGESSEIRQFESYRELLAWSEVEAVLISLPIHLNAEVMLDTVMAGKHLICEKPLASNLNQGRKLAPMLESVAAEKKLVIEIAENYHYRPELEMVRKWAFEEKLIGEVVIIVAQNIIRLDTGTGFAATHWRIDNQYRGGIVMDGGIHYAAMFRRLGGEVEQVQAFSRQMHKSATSSIDTLSVNIRFRNGILGNLIFSGASPNPLPPREQPDCTIYGTNGLIQISKKNDARLLSQVADDGKKAELKETKYWAAEKSSYYLEFLNFYEAIRTGKPVIATPSECLKDLELLIAALDSAEERSVILL